MDDRTDLAVAGGRVGISRRGLLAFGSGRERGRRRRGVRGWRGCGRSFDGRRTSSRARPPDVTLVPEAWSDHSGRGHLRRPRRQRLGRSQRHERGQRDGGHLPTTRPTGSCSSRATSPTTAASTTAGKTCSCGPIGPLIDVGVRWELAIGNHEITEKLQSGRGEGDRRPAAAARQARHLLRLPHGPVDVSALDSGTPR